MNEVIKKVQSMDIGDYDIVIPCSPQVFNQICKKSSYKINGKFILFTSLEYVPAEDAGRYKFSVRDLKPKVLTSEEIDNIRVPAYKYVI